ncbi:hypothetical protein AB833_15225 [Chromatiales bacterium (ex Bugula neritina AB1)]|nr:hypothetical protein AB833_15225 [Chromatiales bacterium (ex Bugula neritina AB1)]
MLPPQIRKFDVVEQFVTDADGARLREVIGRLEANRSVFKQRLDQGVDPTEYKELSAVLLAYDSALSALPNLWERARQDQGQ